MITYSDDVYVVHIEPTAVIVRLYAKISALPIQMLKIYTSMALRHSSIAQSTRIQYWNKNFPSCWGFPSSCPLPSWPFPKIKQLLLEQKFSLL